MRDLPRSTASVEELDGRGLCAVPGLVDCHTHPAWGGDRVEEFSLRAAGASYEELHAAGGGILSTVRATRALGEDGLRDARRAARRVVARATARRRGRASPGYGLDRETELASLRAVRAAGGLPTWLGAHAVPPEFADADAYLDFALAEVLPEARRARRCRRCLPRARRVRRAPRRGAISWRAATAGLALRLHGDQFTESGAMPARDRARRALGRPPRGDGGGRRRGARGAATSSGVLLPASALFLDRPMPPARALVDAGAALALATDFNPGSSFTTEPAARLLARLHAAAPRPGGGARPR